MKTILVLGAGLVSQPLFDYFRTQRSCRLVVAALDVARAKESLAGDDRATVLETALDDARLGELMTNADVVVNLLPATFLSRVSRVAIRNRVPLVSTSYRPADAEEIDALAKDTGTLVLCETGLDPGIDHMTTMSTVRALRSRGARVTKFASNCGGFPATDSHNNPWGYKFAWSPRAAVLAGRRPARFLKHGEVVSIPGETLFENVWPYEVAGQGIFEIYPNHDALAYVDPYGLQHATDVFRGTIRYPGWCLTMSAAARLGLFDQGEREWADGTTFADFLTRLVPAGNGSLIRRVAEFLEVSPDSPIITRLEWAGLFSDRPIGATHASPLDIFVARLETLMQYQPGERDMVALQHHFTAEHPDGRIEQIHARLIEVGDRFGHSAMARTVALPAAIAARHVADGAIDAVGLQIPVLPQVYGPVLEELEEHGIAMKHEVTTRYVGPFDEDK
jgi:saccharopine dehydrogenase-like NADP-dependent oxidoreductase